MMKTLWMTSALVAALGLSTLAQAEQHTVSVGYAHSKVQDASSLNGVNFQYHYEWGAPLSIVGSFSYLKGDDNNAWHDAWGDSYKTSIETKYYSLLVGPAYRVNDYVSIYGLSGVAYTKMDRRYEWRNSVDADAPEGHRTITGSRSSTNFAYAAGVAINPVENWSVNIGYEGSSLSDGNKNHAINGFNIGIGYRF